MAMTYVTGKNSYSSVRDMQQWINCLNIPNISIHLTPWTDEFVVVCSHSKQQKKISRYELEDAKDPKQIILEAISEVMAVPIDKLGDIIREAAIRKATSRIYTTDNTSSSWSDGIYDYNADGSIKGVNQNVLRTIITDTSTGVSYPVSVGSGGGGGSGMWGGGSGVIPTTYSPMVGHGGHVGYTPLTDEEILARDKAFGPYEQALITTAKQKLKQKYWMYIPHEIMYSKNIVIAGGCWTSLFHGDTPHDIDVFILNDEKTKQLARKHVEQVKFKNPSTEIIKEGNSNYMDNDNIEYTAFDMITKIQLITTKFPTRQKLIEHFDMVHCCVSYTPWDDKLYISRDVYETIMKKEIRPQSGVMELVKPYRIEKMKQRGWVVGRN